MRKICLDNEHEWSEEEDIGLPSRLCFHCNQYEYQIRVQNLEAEVERLTHNLVQTERHAQIEEREVLRLNDLLNRILGDEGPDIDAYLDGHVEIPSIRDIQKRVKMVEAEKKRSIDWYQQRFNVLRKWVKEEVEPLDNEVARRYFAICANGSPSPHERADWTETMHGLRLRAEQYERAARERDTLIRMLVSEFNWEDTSYLHAMMHVENAIRNHKADLVVEKKQVESLRGQLEVALKDLREIAHALGICYEADGHDCHLGPLNDLLKRVEELSKIERESIDKRLPLSLDSWHEDDGPVMWWRFPINEPPYVGTPLDDDFPDYVTHWTRIELPIDPT